MELVSRQRILEYTAAYSGERFPDGRPRVADDIVERMKKVTTEEAWGTLHGHGYRIQYEGNWLILHPEQTLSGRAVTARFVPTRPDLNDVINEEGKANNRIGGQNSWVIDTLVKGDVLVIELFGKITDGTFIGDNLGTSIASKTGGTGLVCDGGIRDTQRVRKLPINVFCRGIDPTGIANVTITEINGPVRIGQVTVMPGDVVLGTSSGLVFIPPHLAKDVVEQSESTRLRDYWGKWCLREGKYTPGEIDRAWTETMTAEFEAWKKTVDMDDLEY
ncbi:MAG: RraA family protein [Candidatus Handelsmanbacteria bacterium]|nr:RraA family protein [Candidatus Handelsmanbacteria bacterium]